MLLPNPKHFWTHVDIRGHDECWPWTGRTRDGYGRATFKKDGVRHEVAAHRVAYALTFGEPAPGMHVMHSCDNRPCCNPAHLSEGTHLENIADKVAKGRQYHPPRKMNRN